MTATLLTNALRLGADVREDDAIDWEHLNRSAGLRASQDIIETAIRATYPGAVISRSGDAITVRPDRFSHTAVLLEGDRVRFADLRIARIVAQLAGANLKRDPYLTQIAGRTAYALAFTGTATTIDPWGDRYRDDKRA